MAIDQVVEESSARSHFFMMPNLLDDLSLSLTAFRYYCHIKRRAGEEGAFFESSANAAKVCRMSKNSITKARRELEKHGLIKVEKRPRKHGEFPGLTIIILDTWGKNREHYENK